MTRLVCVEGRQLLLCGVLALAALAQVVPVIPLLLLLMSLLALLRWRGECGGRLIAVSMGAAMRGTLRVAPLCW